MGFGFLERSNVEISSARDVKKIFDCAYSLGLKPDFITCFLLYKKFSIFSKSVFSLSCNGVADYQTVCRLRARKEKKEIFFPNIKFTGFDSPITPRYYACVCCAVCSSSRADDWIYILCFFGINYGCMPLRWCVPQFTFSTSLIGEDF